MVMVMKIDKEKRRFRLIKWEKTGGGGVQRKLTFKKKKK